MQSALDAADAALEAKETALKSLFQKSEIEKLGKLLDMWTLEPHEVKKLNKCGDNTYEFKRCVHLRPRKNLSSNMLDFIEKAYNQRLMLENLTGTTFNPDLNVNYIKLTIHPAQTCCGDQELMSFQDIAFYAAMIILLPVATLGFFKRLNAYMTGIKIVLSGEMTRSKIATFNL